MVIWTLARKDLRLLLRDRRAIVVMLAMPFLFILVLGLILGEGFGLSPDNRLRVYVVNRDHGYVDQGPVRDGMAWFMLAPNHGPLALESQVAATLAFQQTNRDQQRIALIREALAGLAVAPGPPCLAGAVDPQHVAALFLAGANRTARLPPEPWSEVVLRDLDQTAGITVRKLDNLQDAEQQVADSKMSAVLVFGPQFSERVAQCSFLAEGINPFQREGVKLRVRDARQGGAAGVARADTEALDVELVRDPTQLTAAAIIEQVAQVALLRVILPWMIGRAFEKLGQPEFLDILGKEMMVPTPVGRVPLNKLLVSPEQKQAVGAGVQTSIQKVFPKYNLTGKTWASLTKSELERAGGIGSRDERDVGGSGFLSRGALRYQILVPSYTVMFAYFLVLSVGWLFVGERRQGTLKRLQAAPLSRGEILLGKLLPCFALSLAQGLILLGAGKIVFGMNWGPQPWLLLPVVVTTSLSAMGLALLVATLARTENQVAIYGTFLVLVMAMVSGCLMPKEWLGEIQHIRHFTPHAWALDAYNQLLLNPNPNLMIVAQSCAALTGFGVVFIGLAWWFLRLD